MQLKLYVIFFSFFLHSEMTVSVDIVKKHEHTNSGDKQNHPFWTKRQEQKNRIN